MHDWPYESLILKLKAALAEAEAPDRPRRPAAEDAPTEVARAVAIGEAAAQRKRPIES